MRLYLGGHLARYVPQEQAHLELKVSDGMQLMELLEQLQVPTSEVALAVVNGKLVDLVGQPVRQLDQVQLYPPLCPGAGQSGARV